MSKQNEPMTKRRLEQSALAILPVGADHAKAPTAAVALTNALAYGDERYEAGLIDAAKAICTYRQTMEGVPVDEPCRRGDYWGHAGGINCTAGPIHGLRQRREEGEL